MFTGIKSSNGLNSTRLADIRKKGYFTCDNDGLYWISIAITTHVSSTLVNLYRNGDLLQYMNHQHVSTAEDLKTFSSLERLSKGDTIKAKVGGAMVVHGFHYSVLSVFQLTT